MNPVPLMNDPLGRHWRQPAREKITFYRERAYMTQGVFDDLLTYSACPTPTGVYPGKMWKCFGAHGWRLEWYAANGTWGQCVVNGCPIVIAEQSQ